VRIGWFVAAVAPPLVAFWQHLAAGHPVVAGAALCAYEGPLGIGGAGATRWRDRLVNGIDNALGRRFSRFDRRYREFVSGSLRYIDVKGLATIGFYTPELDEVFVDVRMAPSPPSDVPASVFADDGPSSFARRMLSDFLGGQRPAVIAIIGGPVSASRNLDPAVIAANVVHPVRGIALPNTLSGKSCVLTSTGSPSSRQIRLGFL
jgi:hypothetical protein